MICTEESNAWDDGERCASDDGAPCAICFRKMDKAMREAKAEYDSTSPMDRLYDRLDGDLARKKAYAEDMDAAGRGHLLRDEEKDLL